MEQETQKITQTATETLNAVVGTPDNGEDLQQEGPRKLSNRNLFFRTGSGVLGGFVGTMILLICFFIVSVVFQGVNAENISGNPLILFSLFGSVFLASIGCNIVSATLVFLFERDKYKKLMTTLSQVFLLNVLFFFFVLPLYLFIQYSSPHLLLYPMGLHFLLTAFLSAIVQEVISNPRYFMVGMYGLTLGMLSVLVGGLLFVFGLGSTATASQQILLGTLVILYPPMIWGGMMFCTAIVEMVYHFFYITFGLDYLGDISLEEVEEEPLDADELDEFVEE